MLSHNEAKGGQEKGEERGGHNWMDVRLWKKWVKGETGWSGVRKRTIVACDGGNKRFFCMSEICRNSLRTSRDCGHCVSADLAFKGQRILFTFFPFTIWHVGQGLHCFTCDIHVLRECKWFQTYGHKTTQRRDISLLIPEPQTKVKPFHAKYPYSRLPSLTGVRKRYFA